MNEELISQWNTIVGDNDEVYHLGDFSLGSPKVTEEVLDRLKGRIHLIKGNHEKSVLRNKSTREKGAKVGKKEERKKERVKGFKDRLE